MKGTKFLAGLLAGLSVVLGSWGLVACGGADSSPNSSSNSGSSSSEAAQPKGVVYEIVGDTAQVVEYDGAETSVTIAATYNGVAVTKIGDNAFKNSTITSVEIPNSVTSIGKKAFHNCDALTSVTIPNSVTSIGDYAFAESDALTSVVIPDGVTSLGESAFYFCMGLTSVEIPASVTSIGDNLFSYSSSLSSITFKGEKAQWNKIEKNSTKWDVIIATKVVCKDGEVDL